jgi:2-polyprenyl-3-methyl-5-hydroxy-6-metoxy-1,4-benzoquinol methylase
MAPPREDPICFCGSRHYVKQLVGRYDRVLGGDYPFKVVCCAECGLARTLPVPDDSQYEDGYSVTTEDGRFTGSDSDAWSENIADFIRASSGGRTLLDVGCHVGNLVAAARAREFQAEGVDIDPIATAEGRRLRRAVRTRRIEDVTSTYDIVVLNHVLEHVVNLRVFLRHIDRVLAPGGHAFVFVPTYLGLIPRLMGERWMLWVPHQHVWHFTPRTLARTVTAATSLRASQITTTGSLEPPSSGLKGQAKAVLTAFARFTQRGDQIEAIFDKPMARQ